MILQSGPENEKSQLEYILHERVKELKCLYGISELVERYENSVEDILHGINKLIPASWQYPQITCSRIRLDGKNFKSLKFKNTKLGVDPPKNESCSIISIAS